MLRGPLSRSSFCQSVQGWAQLAAGSVDHMAKAAMELSCESANCTAGIGLPGTTPTPLCPPISLWR
jgi:hypothetical protein